MNVSSIWKLEHIEEAKELRKEKANLSGLLINDKFVSEPFKAED